MEYITSSYVLQRHSTNLIKGVTVQSPFEVATRVCLIEVAITCLGASYS